jgi:hypothetical protein
LNRGCFEVVLMKNTLGTLGVKAQVGNSNISFQKQPMVVEEFFEATNGS